MIIKKISNRVTLPCRLAAPYYADVTSEQYYKAQHLLCSHSYADYCGLSADISDKIMSYKKQGEPFFFFISPYTNGKRKWQIHADSEETLRELLPSTPLSIIMYDREMEKGKGVTVNCNLPEWHRVVIDNEMFKTVRKWVIKGNITCSWKRYRGEVLFLFQKSNDAMLCKMKWGG